MTGLHKLLQSRRLTRMILRTLTRQVVILTAKFFVWLHMQLSTRCTLIKLEGDCPRSVHLSLFVPLSSGPPSSLLSANPHHTCTTRTTSNTGHKIHKGIHVVPQWVTTDKFCKIAHKKAETLHFKISTKQSQRRHFLIMDTCMLWQPQSVPLSRRRQSYLVYTSCVVCPLT